MAKLRNLTTCYDITNSTIEKRNSIRRRSHITMRSLNKEMSNYITEDLLIDTTMSSH